MRIAHILRKYVLEEWGGTESAMYQLTGGLNHHNVDSVVFYPSAPTHSASGATSLNGSAHDPLQEAGCTLRRYRAVVPIWGMADDARRQYVAVGGNLLSFDLPRLLSREPDVSVIHSHVTGRLGGIAMAVARRRRIPFVVSIHGSMFDFPDRVRTDHPHSNHGIEWGRIFGWWWRSREVIQGADAILVCNPSEATYLQERFPKKRIITHSHGVEASRFGTDRRADARAAYPSIADRRVLLCVGRIDPQKNQAWLVQQMPLIIQRYPDALLVLAGACTNEAYGAYLQQEIASRRLENHVLLTGGLPPSDPRLVGLFQTARATVLPSITETFGIVILESWAAGIPVLASRTSGAKSLIREARNGWLFDLDDPLSFHQALDRTLRDPILAANQARAGRKLVETQFDTIRIAGRMRDLYAQLIENKSTLRSPA